LWQKATRATVPEWRCNIGWINNQNAAWKTTVSFLTMKKDQTTKTKPPKIDLRGILFEDVVKRLLETPPKKISKTPRKQ
jgi:hypothetical protein